MTLCQYSQTFRHEGEPTVTLEYTPEFAAEAAALSAALFNPSLVTRLEIAITEPMKVTWLGKDIRKAFLVISEGDLMWLKADTKETPGQYIHTDITKARLKLKMRPVDDTDL